MGDTMGAIVSAIKMRKESKERKRNRAEQDRLRQETEAKQAEIERKAKEADATAKATARNKIRKKRVGQTKTLLTSLGDEQTQGKTRKSLLGV